MSMLRRLLKARSGATSMEYGLIVSLIALVLVTALTAFGGGDSGIFNTTMATLKTALGG